MSSTKFYQLNQILPNSASTNVPVKSTLDRIPLNSADLIDFCQVLPSSAKSVEDCVRICAYIATKNPDYLIIRFSRYSFLFFMQRLVLQKSYTLKFRQNLYHSFKSTLKSLYVLTLPILIFILLSIILTVFIKQDAIQVGGKGCKGTHQ